MDDAAGGDRYERVGRFAALHPRERVPSTGWPGRSPEVRRGKREAVHDHSGHGMEPPKPGDVSCSPTWAQPSADGRSVFVACNKANDIVEIDVASWTMKRRIPAGDGVYNLAVTHDGKLLVGTNKRGKSVSVIDIASGKELARIATQRKVVHGVAISGDDRYAFISVEGVGSEPGTVEMIDLARSRESRAPTSARWPAGSTWLVEGHKRCGERRSSRAELFVGPGRHFRRASV